MRKGWAVAVLICALVLGLSVPSGAIAPPTTSARCAVLMDAASGRVLYAQNADEPRPIASITKLMTALVAAEALDLDAPVTIRPEWTGIEGTSLYLRAGEVLTVRTLLYGLLLHSGNDAAVALAGASAGDVPTFVGWMNERAAELGMTHTRFSDPHGLSDGDHYASARDMALLACACLKNETVAAIVATKSIVCEGRSLTNHNKLLWRYDGCTGMKTGYTRQAGRTLASSAARDGRSLVCVTLCDGDDWRDHAALLDYGFAAYPLETVAAAGTEVARVPVAGSLVRCVPVTVRDDFIWPLAEGETARWELLLPEQAEAPVQAGRLAGTVRFWLGQDLIGERYLVWGRDVGRDVLGPHRSWRDRLGAVVDLLG